jgi:N6-L-threonylcarbamoyladenine synthase
MLGRPGYDFSFSGLKTAVRGRGPLPTPSTARRGGHGGRVQAAVAAVVADRCRRAAALFRERHPTGGALVVAGGVAANEAIRSALQRISADAGMPFVAPPHRLCTDNGAMIAWAGIERLRLGQRDGLDFAPRPRWPLDPTAPRAIGAGVKA